jgi:hypothetical protein
MNKNKTELSHNIKKYTDFIISRPLKLITKLSPILTILTYNYLIYAQLLSQPFSTALSPIVPSRSPFNRIYSFIHMSRQFLLQQRPPNLPLMFQRLHLLLRLKSLLSMLSRLCSHARHSSVQIMPCQLPHLRPKPHLSRVQPQHPQRLRQRLHRLSLRLRHLPLILPMHSLQVRLPLCRQRLRTLSRRLQSLHFCHRRRVFLLQLYP